MKKEIATKWTICVNDYPVSNTVRKPTSPGQIRASSKMTNPVSNHDMKVFSGLSNPDLSKRLGRYCGVTVSSAEFCLYNNGERPFNHNKSPLSIFQESLMLTSTTLFGARMCTSYRAAAGTPTTTSWGSSSSSRCSCWNWWESRDQ